MTKPNLVAAVKDYQFLEAEVEASYVDRNPNPNGLLFARVDTSGTRRIGEILKDLKSSCSDSDDKTRDLIWETQQLFECGLFDDQYDNISRVAPELSESFIYKQSCYIGSQFTVSDSIEPSNPQSEAAKCTERATSLLIKASAVGTSQFIA